MSTASRRRAPSLLLGGAGFCVSISWQVVLPILSLYLAHVGFSLAGIGLVVGVFSLSMGLVELQASVIAAALGRRWSLLGGCAANALCLGAAAIAAQPPSSDRRRLHDPRGTRTGVRGVLA